MSPSRLNESRYAAIYVRVSTDDQGKGYAIPTQIEACQRLAQQEGYSVSESHVFIDAGISGTTLDRPALRRLRDLVTAQALDALDVRVTWSPGEPLQIDGSIPIDVTVSNTLSRVVWP